MSSVAIKSPFQAFQVRDVALGATAIFFASLVLALLLQFLLGWLLPMEELFWPLLFLLFYGGFGAWLLRFCQRRSISLTAVVGPKTRLRRWPRLVAVVGLLLLFSLGAFLLWMSLLSRLNPELTGGMLDSSQSGVIPDRFWLAQILKVLVVVGLAPVVEEVLFRGILLQRWSSQWGLYPALLMSSLIFGCFHLNPVGMVVFGLVMALLYIRSQTLLVPIFCHVLNNALLITLDLFGDKASSAQATMTAIQNATWVGFVIVGITVPLLGVLIHQTWPPSNQALPYVVNLKQERSRRARGAQARRRWRTRL